jgi:MFS family permease
MKLQSSFDLASRPSRTRYGLIAFTAALALITYIDRVCISHTAGAIQEELNLTKTQMSLIFASFFWTYALFEVPGGWMGDRWGARRVLVRIVIWWSLFTAATGWAWGFASLFIIRALFGAGEAGCFPNIARAYVTWLPQEERVRAQGLLWLSARWGGALTPLLIAWLLTYVSWRHAFEIFGVVGIVWAVLFYLWYRDNPKDHPGVNAAELALLPKTDDVTLGHEPVPWKLFLTSRTVWLLWIQYTCLGSGWVFYVTWLPTYLQEACGQNPEQTAWLAGVPLLFGGLGSLICGWTSRSVDRWAGSSQKGRRWLAGSGFLLASVCLFLSANTSDARWAIALMSIAAFANDLAMPPSWAACMDVGGKYCGTLSGSMNMMTNLGQGTAPVVMTFLLAATGQSWPVVFYFSATAYALGMVCWLFLDSVTPLARSAEN